MIRRPPRATRTHTLSLHDALPILRHVEGGPDVEVIVELPAPRAILVAADAMDGQVARLRLGQIGVLAHHARERIFERRVAARGASGGLALVVDPFAEAFRVTGLRALGENLGRGAGSLDRDELADILGRSEEHP